MQTHSAVARLLVSGLLCVSSTSSVLADNGDTPADWTFLLLNPSPHAGQSGDPSSKFTLRLDRNMAPPPTTFMVDYSNISLFHKTELCCVDGTDQRCQFVVSRLGTVTNTNLPVTADDLAKSLSSSSTYTFNVSGWYSVSLNYYCYIPYNGSYGDPAHNSGVTWYIHVLPDKECQAVFPCQSPDPCTPFNKGTCCLAPICAIPNRPISFAPWSDR